MNTDDRSAATREAFETFLDRGARGRDWSAWSALFTDDAVYTEHCMGQFHGSAGVAEWIEAAMEPVACMTFSIEWAITEGDLMAFWIWNHLPTPPAGTVDEYCFPNLSILSHAGNGQWAAQEDLYEPAWTACVVDWFRAGGSPTMAPDPTLRPIQPSYPPLPPDGPPRDVVSAALASLSPTSSPARLEVIEGGAGVAVFDAPERAYGVTCHVHTDGRIAFSDVVSNPGERANPFG